MCELPAALATYQGAGFVVAPAGYGKTHLIAESTALSSGRQLILTHTHAGVTALRGKMHRLGVSDQLYHVDTIASWALRLSLSYSATSGWVEERPASSERWNALYDACAHLLDQAFVRRIVRASYSGLYVDEYQDCSVTQHGIVTCLARDLPVRVLGDPLQGIFDFDGQESVNWERDVESRFECLGTLDVPHRWMQAGANELGEWLARVRSCLELNQPIDLTVNPPAGLRFEQSDVDPHALTQSQGNTCRYFECDSGHTVIAIHKGSQEYKAKCHRLSRNLAGRFSSIEEVEGKELFVFINKLDRAPSVAAQLVEGIDLAKKCMTAIDANLSAGTRRGERVAIRANTRNPDVVRYANRYLDVPSSAALAEFLRALVQTNQVRVFRLDLLNRVLGVLSKHAQNTALSLVKTAENYQREFRYKGRSVGRRKLIGTTLLVKGLEFDHSIVLDAQSLRTKELYVALTRGARSLTIISANTVLNPAAD